MLERSPRRFPDLSPRQVAVAGVAIAWRRELVRGVLAVVAPVVAGPGLDMLTTVLLFAAPLPVAGAF